jgi:hypothetical protein
MVRSDHRHRRLLRMRRERPSRRIAEQRDERSPSNAECHLIPPAGRTTKDSTSSVRVRLSHPSRANTITAYDGLSRRRSQSQLSKLCADFLWVLKFNSAVRGGVPFPRVRLCPAGASEGRRTSILLSSDQKAPLTPRGHLWDPLPLPLVTMRPSTPCGPQLTSNTCPSWTTLLESQP